MTLREILKSMGPERLPDELDWNERDPDFRPQTVFLVNIRTSSDDDTGFETYPENPILIPWYGAEVYGLNPSDISEPVLDIWIRHREYVRDHLAAWTEREVT